MRMFFVLIALLLAPLPVHATASTVEVFVQPLAPALIVPRGSQRVPVMNINMTASCVAPVSIETITVQHAGRGYRSDILRLYALENGKRVSTTTTTINSENTATMRFRDFAIPACGTRSLLLAVDISPDAANLAQHQFIIEQPNGIVTDAQVFAHMQLPVSFSVAPSSVGTIGVSYIDLPRTVYYGRNQVVSRIRLEADGVDDHTISAITFTNEGKARNADLQNLVLVSSRGDILSFVVPTLSGDSVRLIFRNPFRLGKHNDVTLSLRSDVLSGRRKTINFQVRDPGDIESAVRRGR